MHASVSITCNIPTPSTKNINAESMMMLYNVVKSLYLKNNNNVNSTIICIFIWNFNSYLLSESVPVWVALRDESLHGLIRGVYNGECMGGGEGSICLRCFYSHELNVRSVTFSWFFQKANCIGNPCWECWQDIW